MATLVLVHVGDKFPEYINHCISQIRSITKIPVQVLISKKHAEKISSNVELFFLEEIPKSENHKKFESFWQIIETTFPGDRSFWKYTMQRFFYLYDHVLNKSLTDVFHIENDNLIYLDFLENLESFRQKQMWCVMDAKDRCIPSFLYFKDHNILHKLTETCILKTTSGLLDMELLAKFRDMNINDVGLLPIVKDYVDEIDPVFFENVKLFNCLFDVACVGQYVGGVDQHNKHNKDINTEGFINEKSVIKCNKMKFEFRNNKPYLNDIPMVNLHIHSKDLKRWATFTDN